jgi:hypothetical protein
VNYFTLARMCRRLLHCCYKVVPGWLGHDGLALKKFCIQLALSDDRAIRFGSVEFQPKQLPDTVTFLPIHLCR